MKDFIKLVIPLALGALVLRAAIAGWRIRTLGTGGLVIRQESGAGDRAHLGNPWGIAQ
jgi:hypothetical protein